MCAHAFCMWLHCFDMLLCPYLQIKTASSFKLGRQPHKFFNSKYLFCFLPQSYGEKNSISLGDGASIFLEEVGMHVNDGIMSWTGAGISHLSSRDVHGVSL